MLYCGFRETEAAFTNSMSSQVDCICMSDRLALCQLTPKMEA